jgi:hypothetical protein
MERLLSAEELTGVLQGRSGFACYSMDDLFCGKVGRERVRLSRPKVDEVGITDAAPMGSQGGCQVVDLWVRRGGRVGVLVQEAVPDAASEPPSERAGERCGSIAPGERLLVCR